MLTKKRITEQIMIWATNELDAPKSVIDEIINKCLDLQETEVQNQLQFIETYYFSDCPVNRMDDIADFYLNYSDFYE